MAKIILILIVCNGFIFSILGAGKILKLEDFVYEENIKTPLFYVKTGEFDEQLNAPVIPVEQPYGLQMEFDELGELTKGYYYKIIHCDANWQQSVLLESEYLKEFINDYLITTYNLSFNTKIKYCHYSFIVPTVKIAGNYVVMVYRDGNQEDIVLTRRFMVYSNRVTINPNIRISTGVEERFSHQQVDFTLNYNNYPNIFNPVQEVNVVIRQNNRWDNAITTLKPLYIKDNERLLDYSFFNLENNFTGGNEFRMFDTRRIRTNGLNVDRISFSGAETNVYLMMEKSRNGKAYGLYFDANGRFVTGNNEVGGNYTDADYINVNFEFKTTEMPFGNIYILGMFNDFKYNDTYKLIYDNHSDSYKVKVLLKQGYYNYVYSVKNMKQPIGDETELEGSFFQTENKYEIIIYHRPIGARADYIIGYYSERFNTPK